MFQEGLQPKEPIQLTVSSQHPHSLCEEKKGRKKTIEFETIKTHPKTINTHTHTKPATLELSNPSSSAAHDTPSTECLRSFEIGVSTGLNGSINDSEPIGSKCRGIAVTVTNKQTNNQARN
jgi:hypothetical protein